MKKSLYTINEHKVYEQDPKMNEMLDRWDLGSRQDIKYKLGPITKRYMKILGVKGRPTKKQWKLINEAQKWDRARIEFEAKNRIGSFKKTKVKTHFIELTADEDLTHAREQYIQVKEDSIILDTSREENLHYIDLWDEQTLIPGRGQITTSKEKYRADGYNKNGLKKVGEYYSETQKKMVKKYVGCGSTRDVTKLDSSVINVKKFLKNTCKNIGCPKCFRAGRSYVARNLASDITAKFQEVKKKGNVFDQRLVHSVISLDMSKYPFFDYDFLINWFRSEVIVRFIQVFHRGDFPMVGFVLHPYRYKKYCRFCGEVNDGRAKCCSKCKSVGDWWLFHHAKGIHFHVITNFSPDLKDPLYYQYLNTQGFTYINISKKNYDDKVKEFCTHEKNQGLTWSDRIEKWYQFNHEWFPFIRTELELWRIIRYELGHAYWNPNKRTRSFFKDLWMRNKYYNITRKDDHEKYTVKVYSVNDEYNMIKESDERGFYHIRYDGEEFHDDFKIKEVFFNEKSKFSGSLTYLRTQYRATYVSFRSKYIDDG